tara:strand:+ start:29474 stop:31285 length:1812 start_codon:yes stop_codon:yes gene_type:complete
MASYWKEAQEQYREERKALLRALDTRSLRIVAAKAQESLDETLRFMTELQQKQVEERGLVTRTWLDQNAQNIRNYQDAQASISQSRITQVGGIEKQRLTSQRELRRATQLSVEAETAIAQNIAKTTPHRGLSRQGWSDLWVDEDRTPSQMPAKWTEQGLKYEAYLADIENKERTSDPVREQYLAVRLWEEAVEKGDLAGASRVAALATGRTVENIPVLRNGQVYLRTDLRRWFTDLYGPITTADTAASRRVISRTGGVSRADMPGLDEVMTMSGLDKNVDLSQYRTRADELRELIRGYQRDIKGQEQAAMMVVSGTAGLSPWTSGPKSMVPATRVIDTLGGLLRNDRPTAKRVLDEVTRGNFDVNVPLATFTTWAEDAIQARVSGTGTAKQGRLGNNVLDYLSAELSAIAQEAKRAADVQQVENVRKRFLSLGESINSPLVQGQLVGIQTAKGRSLSDVFSGIESSIGVQGMDVAQNIRIGANGMSRLISKSQTSMPEQQSELAWLPYQYEDRLSSMSDAMASGDTQSYAQQAEQFKLDLEPLSADLAGDAGVAIRDQIGVAEQSGDYDTLNKRMEELRSVIQDWINAAAQGNAALTLEGDLG